MKNEEYAYMLSLPGARFMASLGVTEMERQVKAEIEVNVTLELKGEACAFVDDNPEGVLDYSRVYDVIRKVVEDRSYKLLEHLAYVMADEILKLPKIEKVNVEIEKINPPVGADGMNAIISFTRNKAKI